LQQATHAAEQHLPVIRQRDAACRAPEQGTLGFELKPLDLLAHCRLRQVEPFGRAVKASPATATNERSNSNSIMGD
jgi:hypothetical protein